MPFPPAARCADDTAIFIGLPETCHRLEQQLDLLAPRPRCLGWVLTGDDDSLKATIKGDLILGRIEDLEAIVARHVPDVALVSLPGVMGELIMSIRTRLRRLGVPDRFMPTLEDLLQGVGPRAQIDIDLAHLLDRPPRPIDEAAIRGVIQAKRVLITGAGGSIGSELARIVTRFDPQELVLVDRSENALFEIDRQVARRAPGLRRRAVLHDIIDPARTLELFTELRPQVIFHAAAHKHVPMMEDHPAQAVDNNLFGTRSVADAAHLVGAERFVMISTDKAVNPSSIMGATKRLAEMYVQRINQRSDTGFSMVRFGNVLGSSGSVIEIWSGQLAEGGPLTVTDPAMTRYFMTIPEAAALVIQSAALLDAKSPTGEVFVLDMGEPIRVVELARRFIVLHGLAARVPGEASRDTEPGGAGTVGIVYTGIRPGEKLFEELAMDAESMQPTRHSDIKIWSVPVPDDLQMEEILLQLSPQRRSSAALALAQSIRRLLPEMSYEAAA